jgi:hypothetical protein
LLQPKAGATPSKRLKVAAAYPLFVLSRRSREASGASDTALSPFGVREKQSIKQKER